MKLTEHAGKQLFREYGIPVPNGFLVRDPSEITRIDAPMVVKAQVPVGGRGKAGGIRFASTVEQARSAATAIIGMDISGNRVRELLVEERLNIDREFYLSITIDRSRHLPLLMMIKEGGMEVESAPASEIMSWPIHPFVGISSYVSRDAARRLVLDPQPAAQLEAVISNLWRLFWEMDCELVEINPLVSTFEGRLVAADAKVVIDEDAVLRHQGLGEMVQSMTELEREARAKGLAMVQLEGDVGVLANGAGLTMATLDNLALHQAKGGVFLDLGGTDDEKVVESALALMSKAGQRVILVNIFGGITKCDTVAEGLIAAREKLGIRTPMVVRVRGVNEEQARKMLADKGIFALRDLDEACLKASTLGGV